MPLSLVISDTERLDHLLDRYRLSITPCLWGTDAGCRYEGQDLRELIDIDIRERRKVPPALVSTCPHCGRGICVGCPTEGEAK